MTWLKGPALLSIGFGIAGLSALLITALMNQRFGVSQGATEGGQNLLGAAAIVIDVAGLVLFGLATGALFRGAGFAKKVGGCLTLVMMLACAAFSIASVMGFVAAERLSVAKAREKQEQVAQARIAAKEQAEKERRDAQIRLATDHMKWAQGTSRQRGTGKSERKEMLDSVTKTITAIGKEEIAQPDGPIEIMTRPDGQAELIAEMTGINKTTVQLTLMSYVSVLLILIKAFSFPLAAFFWPHKKLLPTAITDPIKHGLPAEAQVTVVSGPALEPPPLQKMLPAPLTRPEPPPEGKAALARTGFPKTKPDGEARAMTDEERETVGIRMLVWLTANAIRGDFAQDKVWELFLEFFAAQNVLPMAERHAKPALASVNKGRKYYATKTIASPVVWNIRLPDFEELNGLLDKAGFPAAPKASRAKAEKADPTVEMPPQAEESMPDKGVGSVVAGPFAGSALAAAPLDVISTTKRAPVKGQGELHKYGPDWEGLRSIARAQKAAWQARMITPRRKSLNRFSRARSAA